MKDGVKEGIKDNLDGRGMQDYVDRICVGLYGGSCS